jgi:hypothetical protein
MRSAALRVANRANAARSTGPRTRAGKAIVARNALRHGLSLPVLADPALAADVAALVQRIAGEAPARRAAPPRSVSPRRRSTSSASAACDRRFTSEGLRRPR